MTALLRKDARFVTLTGPGGSGKTRPLATVRDQELVASSIALTVGAHDELAAHFGDKDTLLLLDDLEQVIGAAPGLARLAEACQNLRLSMISVHAARVLDRFVERL